MARTMFEHRHRYLPMYTWSRTGVHSLQAVAWTSTYSYYFVSSHITHDIPMNGHHTGKDEAENRLVPHSVTATATVNATPRDITGKWDLLLHDSSK